MSRPCQWPDGGCGQPVEFFPTGRTKPDGKPVLQVVDAEPIATKVIMPLRDSQLSNRITGSKIVPAVYRDHHATCATWLARIERERAAKAGAP